MVCGRSSARLCTIHKERILFLLPLNLFSRYRSLHNFLISQHLELFTFLTDLLDTLLATLSATTTRCFQTFKSLPSSALLLVYQYVSLTHTTFVPTFERNTSLDVAHQFDRLPVPKLPELPQPAVATTLQRQHQALSNLNPCPHQLLPPPTVVAPARHNLTTVAAPAASSNSRAKAQAPSIWLLLSKRRKLQDSSNMRAT